MKLKLKRKLIYYFVKTEGHNVFITNQTVQHSLLSLWQSAVADNIRKNKSLTKPRIPPVKDTRSVDAEAEHKSHLVPENFLMQAVTAHVLNDQQKQVVRDKPQRWSKTVQTTYLHISPFNKHLHISHYIDFTLVCSLHNRSIVLILLPIKVGIIIILMLYMIFYS